MAIRHRVNPHAPLNSAVREGPVGAAWHGRFLGAVAQHPVYRRLWFGALAASVGQWMQQVALGWLAIVMTNSPGFVGIVTFSAGLPFLVVAPCGGALIDRIDRRRLMLSCQVLAFLLATVLAVDVMSGLVQPWHLPIAAFLNGSLQALLIPTQQSLVPALVPRESLTNAVALMSAGQNMTRVVGPSVAGIVIGTIGVGPDVPRSGDWPSRRPSFWYWGSSCRRERNEARAGRESSTEFGSSPHRPDLRSLFLLAAIPTFFVFPYIGFLNVFARDILHIGAGGLGLLMAVSGCGAVVGSLLVAAAARSEGTGRLLLGMTVLYGLPIVGVALSRTLWITLPMLFMAGMLGAAFMSGNNALVQHRVTDDVRGRVMGAYMLTWGLMPLGALPMGMIADRIGTPVAVAGGAIISAVLTGILGLTSSTVRDSD